MQASLASLTVSDMVERDHCEGLSGSSAVAEEGIGNTSSRPRFVYGSVISPRAGKALQKLCAKTQRSLNSMARWVR